MSTSSRNVHVEPPASFNGLPDSILLNLVIPKLDEYDRFVFSFVDRRTHSLVKSMGPRDASEDDGRSSSFQILSHVLTSVARLRWARGLGCRWNAETCAAVAVAGHVEVLQWARAQVPPLPWDKSTCNAAAQWGNLDVLQWAREQHPPCEWTWQTSFLAAKGGQLEVLKWMRAQHPPCEWNYLTCTLAARGGHLEMLQWARAQDPPCEWKWCARAGAAEMGHLEVVEWLQQHGAPEEDPQEAHMWNAVNDLLDEEERFGEESDDDW